MKRVFLGIVTAGALALAGVVASPAQAHGPPRCGCGPQVSYYGGYAGYGGYGPAYRTYYPGYVPYGAGYIGGYQPYQSFNYSRPRVGFYIGF
jgi:hypothetical protein